MIALPYRRAPILRGACAILAVAALAWYAREHRPRSAAVALRHAEVGAREDRVRSARAAAVIHGAAGLDSLLATFRADSLRLVTRIPPAGDVSAIAGEMTDALGHLERRSGVRITGTVPLPPGSEGPFETDGYRVSVVGRYEQIGILLAELAALHRLTGIRDVRLHAIPDSLLRSVTPFGGTPFAEFPTLDSAGVAAALADAGETPFKAAAVFSLVWYTDSATATGTVAHSDPIAMRGAP